MDGPDDVANDRISDDRREAVADVRERIQQVADTREYPATFSIWTQLVLSVALPEGPPVGPGERLRPGDGVSLD